MGEEQKIWFVYLTDHHEGPFLVEELAEKFRAGVITGASLTWKDGMAEWQPLESIPELSAVTAGGAQATPAPPIAEAAPIAPMDAIPEAAPAAVGSEEPSLAQMLAASQAPASESPSGATPSLSLVPGGENTQAPLGVPSGPMAAAPVDSMDPPEHEVVWNLRNAGSVSGPFSFEQLRAMAGSGELQEGFSLWRPGMVDFVGGGQYPQLAIAPQAAPKAGGGLSNLIKKAGPSPQPKRPGIQSIVSRDGEVTDTNLEAPAKASFVDKIKGIFAKFGGAKKKKAAPAAAKTAATKTKRGGGNSSALVKRLALYLGVLAVLGGAGAYYYLFMMSPIPAIEDVTPEQYEQLKDAAKGAGDSVAVALSQEDLFNPKFYVTSGLPEGTVLTLKLDGVPGKLVNVLDFHTKVNAPMAHKMATFGPVSQDGKPIPMGEYTVSVVSGTKTLAEKPMFLGGPKGPIYERRMKQYQEKLQQSYDAELQELREVLGTVKGLRDDYTKKLSEVGALSAAGGANSARVKAWSTFGGTFNLVLQQLETKLKAKAEAPAGAQDIYYPKTYTNLLAVVRELLNDHKEELTAMAGGATGPSAASLAKIQGILTEEEQTIAKAATVSPLQALSARAGAAAPAGGAPAIPAPTPPASSAPVTPPAPGAAATPPPPAAAVTPAPKPAAPAASPSNITE